MEDKNKDRVFLVTSGKGGVGKTTISASIADIIANRGNKVILIDMDLGLRNLDLIMGLEGEIKYDIMDFLSGKCKLKDTVVRDLENENLYLLPATETSDVKLDITKLNLLIAHLRDIFDYIIIDAPAGLEEGFKHSTTNIDRVLLVVNQDKSSLTDAVRMMNVLNLIEIYNIDIVVNRFMYKKNSIIDVEDIEQILDYHTIVGVVKETEDVLKYANKGIIPTKIKGIEFERDIIELVDCILQNKHVNINNYMKEPIIKREKRSFFEIFKFKI